MSELWLQDQVARGKLEIRKISGEDNFSDSLTKHSGQDRIKQTMDGASQRIMTGRHAIMPEVAK